MQPDEIDEVEFQSKQDEQTDKLLDSTAHFPTIDLSRMTYDPQCLGCQLSFQNLKPDQLTMYLHAYSYQVRFCDSSCFDYYATEVAMFEM